MRQVARLRRAIGRTVYIVELTYDGLAIGAIFHGEPRVLLDIVDFPRPDTATGLYPHLLVFNDGRGINLGRLARVTVNSAFDPRRADILYCEPALQRQLLYGPRRLTPERVAEISRRQLGALLGRLPAEALIQDKEKS